MLQLRAMIEILDLTTTLGDISYCIKDRLIVLLDGCITGSARAMQVCVQTSTIEDWQC